MKKTLLASAAAAALVITTGLAGAQGQGPGSTSGASGASPSAPQAAPPASTSGQSGSGTLNRSDSPGSMDGMKSDRQPGDRVQRDGAPDQKRAQDSKQPNNMKADTPSGSKAAQDNKMAPGSKSATDSQTKSSTTTGQAGAGAKISTEQRTQITSVIKQQNVKPVTNVNFSISVGAKIPRGSVTFHALPAQVVTIYPEWRGHEYILVGSEIVVVNPRTLEIVAVLEA